ncbi:MAG TPA: hypothetical protein VL463_14725 [Kofleriaceae bacterium]|nr:hypothetical protein [Kofleriaceae bacterium]
MRYKFFACLLVASAGCAGDGTDQTAADLSGATFTTNGDGTQVDGNVYASKSDVYIDGGPGAHAPSKAAALPEGNYYFQVTDPSGKTLLSSDDISCREFHVNASGVIDAVVGSCAHVTGTDSDHGGITVQLMPFDDTPNAGGEYKVWVTPVENYGDGHGVKNGFVPRYSKTDNFKIGSATSPTPDAGVPTPTPDAPCADAAPPPPPPPADANTGPDACTDAGVDTNAFNRTDVTFSSPTRGI